MITLVDGTIPVAADFNTNYTRLNQAMGTATSISTWAIGEIPYASATDTLARLTAGTTGKILTMGLTTPQWDNPAVLDQITGLTISNNVADATNDIDIAVGAAASNDTVIANRVLISLTSAITKRLDAAWVVGTNQGGLATGGAIANGTYHVFVIKRPDTGVVDVAFDSSEIGANIATNTNVAYTKFRRIGSIIRSAGVILPFIQDADLFQWLTHTLDLSATANPGTSAVTRTITVPFGINVEAIFTAALATGTATTSVYGLFSDLATTDEVPTSSTNFNAWATSAASSARGGNEVMVRTNTSAQIRSRLDFSDANVLLSITTRGYRDRRGRG